MTVSVSNFAHNDMVSDFEFLVALAKNDPQQFEQVRQKIIQEFINSNETSKQQMLKRFQWRIDQTRLQANNPLHAFIKISEMMWQSFDDLGNAHRQLLECAAGEYVQKDKQCEVIDFNEYIAKK